MDTVKDKPKSESIVRVQSSTFPDERPDFYNWCKQFRVSMLHNRSDHWLDFDLDRNDLRKKDKENVRAPGR